MNDYDSLNAAARGLLGEATSIALKCGREFAVCGGWSPFLRNSVGGVHPGTRDVDLLFSEGATEGALGGVVEAFLENGYLVSAKHSFQVLRTLSVRGRLFVFNVDLLHPRVGEISGELCVDHLSLPVPLEDFGKDSIFLMSIALPSAEFVFDGYIDREDLSFVFPDGSTRQLEVPILDEVGLISTKSKCCALQKRPRDIFDIYLAISSPKSPERFKKQLARFKKDHPVPYAALESIRGGLQKWTNEREPPAVFAERGVDFSIAADTIRKFLEELDFARVPAL